VCVCVCVCVSVCIRYKQVVAQVVKLAGFRRTLRFSTMFTGLY